MSADKCKHEDYSVDFTPSGVVPVCPGCGARGRLVMDGSTVTALAGGVTIGGGRVEWPA